MNRAFLLQLAIAGTLASGVSQGQDVPIPEAPKEAVVTTTPKSQLAFKVIVVDDLTPKPVPFNDFKIQPLNDLGEPVGDPQTFRTAEDGTFTSDLPPGKYVLQSAKPLTFKGRIYEWKHEVVITEGQVTSLQLTGDDATSRDQAIPTTRQVADEAKIYQALSASVATVESETGHGTGFLIDSNGPDIDESACH